MTEYLTLQECIYERGTQQVSITKVRTQPETGKKKSGVRCFPSWFDGVKLTSGFFASARPVTVTVSKCV